MTVLQEVAFVTFLSFYRVWFGYNFVANRWELRTWPNIFSTLYYYSIIAKLTDLIRYSQTVNGLFQKNPNIGTWGCTFLKIPSGIFRFVTLPLEITKLSPLEILKNCVTPFGSSKVKNQDPWKFYKCFSLTNTCGYSTSFLIDH